MATNIGPTPQFPEKAGSIYERKVGDNLTRRGPLRFEEGVATDTDVPNDFQVGIMQGYITAPGRPNHNAVVWEKYPEETMKERAHVGSASWVEAPSLLGQFASAAFNESAPIRYEEQINDGGRQERQNPATITE